ncbi:protein DpdJ [Kribbella lupini]|uniref:Helicase ATP-binding domain-containing protein n=1 Tax=Kribbella lupini TaxID=291602 RepID=A0ABN2BXF1_9ACTN
MNDIQIALTALELREAELLSWGAVGAQWTRGEAVAVLAEHGDGEALFTDLEQRGLLVRTPTDGYRTRSAETMRLLATLRQAFRGDRILNGRPLVLDYRFLQRPLRRPRRAINRADFVAALGDATGVRGLATLAALAPPTLSAFQQRSTASILTALNSPNPRAGVVITAGTGSGKTLAFYLPLFAWLTDNVQPQSGKTTALALYPRNELLKDQLQTLVGLSLDLAARVPGSTPLSIASWFGPTPRASFYIADHWSLQGAGYLCPYLRCPTCSGDLIWPKAAVNAKKERLECVDPSCATAIPGSVLRLTRDSAQKKPADIMLSTTESLNRQLSVPMNLRAFGISMQSLKAVLLDEIHTYEGTTGAQNAILLRRLRKALGKHVVWAGLSATLTDAGDFFGRLVDLNPGDVTVIEPSFSELEESGAEYLVALRHDPHSSTGPLSASIQAAMSLSRSLDVLHGNPFNPPIDSEGLVGTRLFTFTDKLDSTNRLYWDLLDAEGWSWPGRPNPTHNPHTLAHLRSPSQDQLAIGQRQPPDERDQDGQLWWLAELLGHDIDGDVQKKLDRTSSQDSGVATDADIVIATASLEVGFDDDRVGAVLQHKAPHDVAQFLQRKGRAGRNAATRPWTVVVLSNFGRDRDAWDAYDTLFSPTVPARSLPIENLYVLRIQAVYSLLDWLAQELDLRYESSWTLASGPAELLHPNNATKVPETRALQAAMTDLLSRLLRDGTERGLLRRHLRRSLALGDGPHADRILEQIFWEAPRPLLTSVIPTLRRRLVDQWVGERPAPDDSGLKHRTPLRDFVPGNLFDELTVPDVAFSVPWVGNEIRSEQLPALRAIREFLPGNVSRHFGVWATHKRHWVPLPEDRDADGARWVDVATYSGIPVDDVQADGQTVAVYAPLAVTLSAVDSNISDSSSMRANWKFTVMPLGAGVSLNLPSSVTTLISHLSSHLHVQGGGVRLMRYTTEATGVLRINGAPRVERIRFGKRDGADFVPAALGVEIHCDALIGHVLVPGFTGAPSADERAAWMEHQIMTGDAFPADMISFDRSAIAEVLRTVAVTWAGVRQDPPDQVAFARELITTSELLGVTRENVDSAAADWLQDASVQRLLLDLLVAARAAERSESWLAWLRRRYTLSAANLLLTSLTSWGSGVDADELTVDLHPDDESRFVISEQSPGGTGQIEALSRAVAENPDNLGMTLRDAIRPSELEMMDTELRSLLAAADNDVAGAIQVLTSAWRDGHQAVRAATRQLETALRGVGVELGHAARTALATRLVGPGAHAGLIDEISVWMSLRDRSLADSGFAIDPRTLAVLLADRTEADPYLRLQHPTRVERARAISNLLWPWGESTRSVASYNPYAPFLATAVDGVRDHWSPPVTVLDVTTWNDEARRTVHVELARSREAIVRVRKTERGQLREVILDLNTVPVEVGPLMFHPRVTAVSEVGEHVEARILLPEAWL